MPTSTTLPKRAEIKARTTPQVKAEAAAMFSRWGLSLNEAINLFLIKSIEVGGLPFNLRPEKPAYEALAARAHRPELDQNGIAILPVDWDDDE